MMVALAASSFSCAVATLVNSDGAGQSSGKFSRTCDPHAIRRMFPERWRDFLRSHFRGAVEVAFVFSVDEKTARHWWNGTTAPSGWAVDFARSAYPDAKQWAEAA